MTMWNSQDGRSDGRIQDAAASLRLQAYRLECAGQFEPGAAQRTIIAAIRSELASTASVLEVLAPAVEAGTLLPLLQEGEEDAV
jgi:hypothetical protein